MAHGDHLKDNAKPKEGRKTFCRLISYLSCDRRLLFVIGFLIIVSIIATLDMTYSIAIIIPPKTNQIILRMIFIELLFIEISPGRDCRSGDIVLIVV